MFEMRFRLGQSGKSVPSMQFARRRNFNVGRCRRVDKNCGSPASAREFPSYVKLDSADRRPSGLVNTGHSKLSSKTSEDGEAVPTVMARASMLGAVARRRDNLASSLPSRKAWRRASSELKRARLANSSYFAIVAEVGFAVQVWRPG